ncbi:MAG: WecB/TagA/CpsF family glycosyltransferase [Candidatus Levybacteria bacterium]|nr:WecB/TagA/CpsF family glycosyltransferase [Candidatus Levybacteria bacterium]
MKKLPDKISLLGIDITNATEKEILEYLLESLRKLKESYYIVTPNPEIIVYASKRPHFQTILHQARLALPDGIGVILAGLFLGQPFQERITGADFMEKICQRVATSNIAGEEKPIAIGFLGGRRGVAQKTAECLMRRYPGLNVVFAAGEWDQEGFIQETKILRYKDTKILREKIERTKKSSPNILVSQYPSIDILFVAFGFPKQEEWMAEHMGKIPVRIMMGVGGAFDYISGSVSRAPFFIRLFGFEWLYRLIREPWRIIRQLSLLSFIVLTIKEFINLKRR